MSFRSLLPLLAAVLVAAGCAATRPAGPQADEPWRALHLIHFDGDAGLDTLSAQLPELAARGVNVLVVEVDYHFAYQSHPELRQGEAPMTRAGARRFVGAARRHGIRVIPQFQVLGHQSWAKETFPLLTQYPAFDLTPGAFPGNEGLYCREWDPLNPQVHAMAFDLVDELIDAFDADAFHVGMDEVFLLGSEHSPSTRGKDPAVLFADVVNAFHRHLVEERGVEMLMWADRLIDDVGLGYGYGEWEASHNGTARAVDLIPKDIILCDWHYEPRAGGYPSVPMFLEKGFRVLPSSWRKPEAVRALITYSLGQQHPRMLGHLFTTWDENVNPLTFPALQEGLPLLTARSAASTR